MRRQLRSALAALAALAAAAPARASIAMRNESECSLAIVGADGVATYGWNLAALYNGGRGHQVRNASTGQTFSFEVCGALVPSVPVDDSGACTPEVVFADGQSPAPARDAVKPCTVSATNADTYTYCNSASNSFPFYGRVLQFLEPSSGPCVLGACPKSVNSNGACPPWIDPVSGWDPMASSNQYCCTGSCEVIASNRGSIEPLDPTNFTRGVTVTFVSTQSDPARHHPSPNPWRALSACGNRVPFLRRPARRQTRATPSLARSTRTPGGCRCALFS